MISLNIQIPETVAAEFYQAADELNKRLGSPGPGRDKPLVEAKTLMAFALARHESGDICAQFDLALRLVRSGSGTPFNPLIK